jgi:uncharacterized protein (TIGR03067 family)
VNLMFRPLGERMYGLRPYSLVAVAAAAGAAGCSSEAPQPAPAAEGRMEPGWGRYWDDLPEADGGPDLLTGRWVVSRTEHGELAFVPGLPFAGIRDLTFADGRCTVTFEAKDCDPPLERVDFAVAFDPAAAPKGLDLTTSKSDRAWRWIYKLTSGGQLLLAVGRLEAGRPAGFDPSRHPVTLLMCDRAAP